MREPADQRSHFDIAVIGGGINGCGIAADAAGRGLDVVLLEQDDIASGTSSASSKLIHGGLRYLEHYEFRLVRHALQEREVLLANAPHIIWPLRFVVPHAPHMRSRLLMRIGLMIYDNLARRRLIPGSGSIDIARDPAARPLSPAISHAFHYSDCWVDDARLAVLVAKQAAEHGASIRTRRAVVSAVADGDRWRLTAVAGDGARGAAAPHAEITARVLVNAAGPWAGLVGAGVIRRDGSIRTGGAPVRLVKGSHIVVPRIPGASDAYLLQASDGRVVFVLPFAGAFSLIGTTDVPFDGDPADAAISDMEEQYLISVANGFLAAPISRADIVWRFAGVRPLYDDASDDPSAVTRDYRLVLDAPVSGPPLLTVVGGKVTTYRRLAEAALDRIAPHAGKHVGPAWTHDAPLPGGDMAEGDFAAYSRAARKRWPWLPEATLGTLLRRYGTRTAAVLGDAAHICDLGRQFTPELCEREVAYLVREEWARTPADILWRRTKAGLGLAPSALAEVESAIAEAIAQAH